MPADTAAQSEHPSRALAQALRRDHRSLTAPLERPLLAWLCRRVPARIVPDQLTALGLAGAAIACAACAAARADRRWLLAAIAGLALNWLGDSLDGSLARHRGIERPRYGFFADHVSDVVAMALIALGIGLSPVVRLPFALGVLAAYDALVIQSMATALVAGTMRISFGGVGPTEIRLVIAACAACALAFPVPHFALFGQSLTLYEGLTLAVTAALAATFFVSALRTLRALVRTDPPRAQAPASENP